MLKNNRHGQAAALCDADLDRLVAAAPSATYAALWTLQRWTAARIGEALALTWGDVRGGVITFRRATTKMRRTRQLPVSPHLAPVLERWRRQWTELQGREPQARDSCSPAGMARRSRSAVRRWTWP